MAAIFRDFHNAQREGNGRLLASCLAPTNTASDPRRLYSLAQLSNYQTIQADIRYHIVQDKTAFKLSKAEANAWIDIFVSLWKCVKELVDIERNAGGDWAIAFKTYKDLCNQLLRGYTNFGFDAWTVPCLYMAGRYLRMIAIKADAEANRAAENGQADVFASGLSDDIATTGNKNEKLEEAARTLQQMFNVCRTDDSDIADSRKWGIYSMSNLLFKTFFKLNNISLTKTIIRALDAQQLALPPFDAFPKSQRCTFTYYRGIIEFLQEHYSEAEQYFTESFSLCPRHSARNREQILTYLIPAHMLVHQQLPSPALLSEHPILEQTFLPLCRAIKSGNLSAFDQALSDAEDELVRRRIYLTLERTRDLCMRNLFRKVFVFGGYEDNKDPKTGEVLGQIRRTRIRIEDFETGIRIAYTQGASDAKNELVMVDRDEVECFLANMIYKVSAQAAGVSLLSM